MGLKIYFLSLPLSISYTKLVCNSILNSLSLFWGVFFKYGNVFYLPEMAAMNKGNLDMNA